jgi:hypothetical protein
MHKGRGIALPMPNFNAGQRHSPAALSPGKRPGTHYTGGSCGPQGMPGRAWGRENVLRHDLPTHIECLYRPRCSSTCNFYYVNVF